MKSTLSAELRRMPFAHYTVYLLCSMTSTLGFYVLVTNSNHAVCICIFPVLSAALFFYLLHNLHPTPFTHYLFLSTSTFLLGFIAHRLPPYLFENPECATPAQIFALHFGLAFNLVADVEWIRLGVLPKDDTFLYPDVINGPFQHPFHMWYMSNPPPLPPFQDMMRYTKVYLMSYRWNLCFYASNYCLDQMICYVLGTGKDAYHTMWGFEVLYNTGGYIKSGCVEWWLLTPVRLGNTFIFSAIAGWLEKREEKMTEMREAEKWKCEVWIEHNKSGFA